MIRFFLWLGIFVFLTIQPAGSKSPDYLPELTDYVGLTPMQVSLLLDSNRLYSRFLLDRDREIAHLRVKLPLNPPNLSAPSSKTLIGQTCAEIGAFAAAIRKHNIALLNDSQRIEIQELAESIQMGASAPDRDVIVVEEARSANLLPMPALIKNLTEDASRECSSYWSK